MAALLPSFVERMLGTMDRQTRQLVRLVDGLLEVPRIRGIYLVSLSGLGNEEHRRRSKEAGFDRHVGKPADLAALQSVLNERPQPA